MNLNYINTDFMIILAIALLIGLGLQFLFLRTLYRCLLCVHPQNRKLAPGLVFLMFIPLFNLVWRFIVVNRLAESLRLEFALRNSVPNELFPGRNTGISYAVASVVSATQIPVLAPIGGIVGLVLWLVYWSKMASYRKTLLRIPLPPQGAYQQELPHTHTPAGWRPREEDNR